MMIPIQQFTIGIILAVLSCCSLNVAGTSDESCTSTIVTISGADSASGTFTLADLSTYSSTASDIIIYTRTVDGGSFSLTGYSNNTSGRRRKLAGEEEEVQEERGAATLDLGSKLDTARKVAINGAAAVAAAAAAGETLTECATGLWSIDGWVDNEIVYPFYRTSDCAAHPADITSEWHMTECKECTPESTTSIVISCGDDGDSGSTTTGTSAAAKIPASVGRVLVGVTAAALVSAVPFFGSLRST